MDGAWRKGPKGTALGFDVSVTDARGSTYSGSACSAWGGAAHARATEKNDKYKGLLREIGYLFAPVVWETPCNAHPEVEALLRDLAAATHVGRVPLDADQRSRAARSMGRRCAAIL